MMHWRSFSAHLVDKYERSHFPGPEHLFCSGNARNENRQFFKMYLFTYLFNQEGPVEMQYLFYLGVLVKIGSKGQSY